MTWTAIRKHADAQIDDFELELFRQEIPRCLEQFQKGSDAAVDQLAFPLARMLIARGPAFVRSELEPIKHILPRSVAAYVESCPGEHTLAPTLLEYANVTNICEIVGLAVPPEVMSSFRPLILRVETDWRDS